jgi:Fe-S cluster biogenesis protein NfuA
MSLLDRLLHRNSETGEQNDGPLYEAVKSAMEDVQSYARSHGGAIELISVTESGEVKIRFSGACRGCPMSGLTLKLGIEEQLKIRVPGVRKVVAG